MGQHAFIGWAKRIQTNTFKVLAATVLAINGAAAAPIFSQKAVAVAPTTVTINEISSYDNSGDWVELYNPTDSSVDLTGWLLKDKTNNSTTAFSASSIAADGFVTVDFSNKLNRNGDIVYLYNGVTLVDTAAYGTEGSIPAPTASNTASSTPDGSDTWILQAATTGASNAPDTTPPVVTPTVTPEANASGWHNDSVTVSWEVTDLESGITSTAGCDGAVLTEETEGMVVACSATSEGGETTESVTVMIDTTLPTANISDPEDGQTVNETVDVIGTADDEHFQSYTLEIYNSEDELTTCTNESETAVDDDVLGTCNTTALADGDYYALLTVTDAAGNTSTDRVDFSVDNTAPVVEITSPSDGATLQGTTTLTATIQEVTLPLTYVLCIQSTEAPDDEEPECTTTEDVAETTLNLALDTTALPNGTYVLGLAVLDGLGNFDEDLSVDTVTFTVQNAAPVEPPTPDTGENPDTPGRGAGPDNTSADTPSTATDTSTTSSGDGEVLGYNTEDTNNTPEKGHTQGTSTDRPSDDQSEPEPSVKSKEVATLLGIAWYLWIPIVLGTIAILYYVYKHADTDDDK